MRGCSGGWASAVMAILFISGGAEFAREVYRTERRGYWSDALPLALEKHGHVSVETAGPEALQDPEGWERYDAVLIARLPPRCWTAPATEAVLAGTAQTLVEAPLPSDIRDALGIIAQRGLVEDGLLSLTSAPLLRQARETYGVQPGGPVVRPSYRRVSRDPEHDWTSLPRVPISLAQAAAWRAPGWEVERWNRPEGVEVLAEWRALQPDAVAHPAVVRRENLTACALSLFAYLGQAHTGAPADGADHRPMPRVTGVEVLLLALIDDMYARAGRTRARLLPWSDGVRWVRSIRHDFDRPLPMEAVKHVVSKHREVGTAVTWYWRSEPRRGPKRAGPAAADLRPAAYVAGVPNHEVALHVELLWDKSEEEQGIVETAIRRRVLGITAHGARNCFRFQGAPNLLWAEERGLLYSEALSQSHLHPHRFAALGGTGEVTTLEVVCLPHHTSFDLNITTTNTEAVLDAMRAFIAARGLMQVMNHPDINTDELFTTLAHMPDEGRADMTAAQAADWWRRTHVLGAVTIDRVDDETFDVTSRSDLDSLALELLGVDGLRVELAVSLKAGVPKRVATGDVKASV